VQALVCHLIASDKIEEKKLSWAEGEWIECGPALVNASRYMRRITHETQHQMSDSSRLNARIGMIKKDNGLVPYLPLSSFARMAYTTHPVSTANRETQSLVDHQMEKGDPQGLRQLLTADRSERRPQICRVKIGNLGGDGRVACGELW